MATCGAKTPASRAPAPAARRAGRRPGGLDVPVELVLDRHDVRVDEGPRARGDELVAASSWTSLSVGPPGHRAGGIPPGRIPRVPKNFPEPVAADRADGPHSGLPSERSGGTDDATQEEARQWRRRHPTHLQPRPRLRPPSRRGWTGSRPALEAADASRGDRPCSPRTAGGATCSRSPGTSAPTAARTPSPRCSSEHLAARVGPRRRHGHRVRPAVPGRRTTRSSRASSPSRPRSGDGRGAVRLQPGGRPLGRLDGHDRARRPARPRAARSVAHRSARPAPRPGAGTAATGSTSAASSSAYTDHEPGRRRARRRPGRPDRRGQPAPHGRRHPHPREERAGRRRVAQALPLARPARPGVGRRTCRTCPIPPRGRSTAPRTRSPTGSSRTPRRWSSTSGRRPR